MERRCVTSHRLRWLAPHSPLLRGIQLRAQSTGVLGLSSASVPRFVPHLVSAGRPSCSRPQRVLSARLGCGGGWRRRAGLTACVQVRWPVTVPNGQTFDSRLAVRRRSGWRHLRERARGPTGGLPPLHLGLHQRDVPEGLAGLCETNGRPDAGSLHNGDCGSRIGSTSSSGARVAAESLVVCPRNDLTSLSVADNTAKPPIVGHRLGVAVSRTEAEVSNCSSDTPLASVSQKTLVSG